MNQISVPRSGMTTDLNTINLDGTKYPYALNATVESISQDGNFVTLQNEGSNRLAVNIPDGYTVIGYLPIHEQNRTIFFLVNSTTGFSQIGEVLDCNYNDDTDDNDTVSCADCEFPIQVETTPLEKTHQIPYCTYHSIVTAECFDFDINFPVRAKYLITDCSLNIYFTDALNQRRFLYFDYTTDGLLKIQDKFKVITGYTTEDCPEPIYSEDIDCNKINYHPQYGLPCLKVIDVITGGSLKAGVYQFFIAYSDEKGNPFTYYFPATHPIPIFSKQITLETNYSTDKAIALKLEGIDSQLYTNFTVVIAETIDNFTTFKQVGIFSTTRNQFTYTGNEFELKKLTPDDVFFRNVFYNTAGNITSSNNILFFSDLQQFGRPNLQRAANRVKLHWQTIAIPEAVYKDPKNTYRYKSNMRDEVYPYGLVFVADNSEEYGPYHLPGPSKEDFAANAINVDQLVNNDDVVDRNSCVDNLPCCGDTGSATKTGTISLSCSDSGCTEQGIISATFTFPEATLTDITLEIGAVIEYTVHMPPDKVVVGTDIFPLPSGMTPWTYYNPLANKPFVVEIPAGTTTYTVSNIKQIGGTLPWICQSCDAPVRELYIKATQPTQLRLSMSNSQGILIHNLLNPGGVITEGCVDCECDSETAGIRATVSATCNCATAGHTNITIHLETALPTDTEIHIGGVNFSPLVNTHFSYGYNLLTPALPPTGTVAWPLYRLNSARPFTVTIPAGVTTFNSGDIVITDRDITIPPDNSTYRLACNECNNLNESIIEKMWFKTITPGVFINFSSTNSVIVETLGIPEPGDPVPCTGANLWEIYNTGFVIGSPHELFINCEENTIWEWGQFSYWQSTEHYPNDPVKWGDLCGKPIRFHKFPDSNVTHIHDGLNAGKLFKDENIVYPIGIMVDHASVIEGLDYCVSNNLITPKDRARIREYRVIRGNRVGHKSIVAKGLIYDMWQYQRDGITHYYPNYPYNDLRNDKYISNTKSTYSGSNTSDPIPNQFVKTSRYTFHSPDTHFVNSTIGTELKLETVEYGESEGFWNKCLDQAKYRFLSAFSMTLAFGAGIAAAFSSEKEYKCKTVVLKSETSVGIPAAVTTGSLGLLAPLQILDYGELSGQPDFLSAANNFTAGEVHKQSCKGKPFQLLSILSGNPAGILTGGVMQPVYILVLGLKAMQVMVDTMKALTPLKNLSIQYNSVGRYSNYKTVANNAGVKIRAINRSGYLDPIVQLVNEGITANSTAKTNVRINNWNRERSVYIKLDQTKALPNTSVVDNSRVTMDDIGYGYDDLGKRAYRTIASYYASVKNYVPDQYGRISDLEYVDTENCTFKLDREYTIDQSAVFGGDTFINRFGLKRKMPFFLQTRFKDIPEGDVQYSELGNVGYPNYYFNTEEPLFERMGDIHINSLDDIGAAYTALIGVARTRMDAKTNKAFYQNGYVHLYNYGIPYGFVESDVNVDYRHGENNLEKDFYPHQQDLEFWLQERNVPITEDNYYFYNKTYSKQNKESPIGIEPDTLKGEIECRVNNQYRIIYSDEANNNGLVDEWLIFRANNFKDFAAANGKVIGLDGIENDKVLVRFENTTQIFNAYSTLQSDTGDIVVGNAGIFRVPPQDFASTSLGYAGSQHKDMLKTEYGHVWVDAKRGQIFLLSSNAKGLDEITKDGMNAWFKANLPFQVKKDFPSISLTDLDNSFNGIGIALSFDKRFNRFFVTKLDYKKIHSGVAYDAATKEFRVSNVVVQPTDTRYFCNRSWTASYNLLTKSWVSFHSFTPNYYIDQLNYFQSGIKGGVWSHNVSNKSYQVYYGKLYPFIIETLSDPALQNTVLNSVEFDSEAIRYHNAYDSSVKNVTFNKAIVYNERQCSGLLHLVPRDETNIYQSLQFPFVDNGMLNILLTNKESRFRFNQFYDTVNSQGSNVPFLVNTCNNADKVLNAKALNYYKSDVSQPAIRSKQTRTRLINDDKSNYKLLFYFQNSDKTPSFI